MSSSSPPTDLPELALAPDEGCVEGARRRWGWWEMPGCLLLSDLAALLLAMSVAIVLAQMTVGWWSAPPIADRWWTLALPALAVPFLAAFRLYHGDRRRITVSGFSELSATFHAMTLFGFVTLLVVQATPDPEATLTIRELLLFSLISLLTIPLGRSFVRAHAIRLAAPPQRTLIVGTGRVGQDIARRLAARREHNVRVVGFLDSSPLPLAEGLAHLPVLGGEADIVRVVREASVERVVVCFSRTSHEELLGIMRQSGLEDVYVSIVPRLFEVLASNVEVDEVAGIPLLDLRPARLSRAAATTKRLFDVGLTLLAVTLLVPLFAAIAIAIKLDSRGPVFFRQLRMGRTGTTFLIYKFRTMCPDAEGQRSDLLHLNEVTGPLFKLKDDPRVTSVGRLLRTTSLDELPQLLNVLRGEMSLVGPRPLVVHEAEEIAGWARRRVDVTPGITGAWQVMGRNAMPFDEMVKLDYLYVTNWSLAWDIQILLRTIPAMLRQTGV